MKNNKKPGLFNGRWAVVTCHPWLPSRSEQVARARAWGVTESMLGRNDISAMIVDDVLDVGRTTNWMGKLIERDSFLKAMQRILPADDEVFFATPLCLGPTEKVARQTVDLLWSAGMLVYVHAVKDNGAALYSQGDDLTELFDMIRLGANAAHQRTFRARS